MQTAIIQLYLKRRHRQTDAAFDEQCRFNHESRGPGNYYPRSLWLMKKIAGVTEARKVQVSHMITATSPNVLCVTNMRSCGAEQAGGVIMTDAEMDCICCKTLVLWTYTSTYVVV